MTGDCRNNDPTHAHRPRRGPDVAVAVLAMTLAGVFGAPAAAETGTSDAIAASTGNARAGEQGPLALPIACTLGETCWIQNLVDIIPGDGTGDFRCTDYTYDTHSGTDFRIASRAVMEAGVAVLAAAAGRVLRIRDGEPDRTFDGGPDDFSADDVDTRECGNGVVIDHGGGLETQYCHMKSGSIDVAPGDTVKAGTPIGLVGGSGRTAFVHLHFGVRRDGEAIDPFTGLAVGAGGCEVAGTPLWADPAPLLAHIEGQVVNAGFTTGRVAMADIETGAVPVSAVSEDAPAIVFFGRAANLAAGDQHRIVLRGPGLDYEDVSDPLPRKRAQSMIFAGRRAPEGGLEPGVYTGHYEVLRNGTVLDAAVATMVVQEAPLPAR